MGRKEAVVEEYLRDKVDQDKGFYRKVVYQGRKGSPDDWCFFQNGRLLIVECKADNETPEALQVIEMKLLRNLGFWVTWADSKAKVDAIFASFHTDTLRKFNEKFPIAP